ncbi:PQQ-binding-like beta-propeller repeat protein [Nocardioides sp. MH1]|uniref:outer membrane protein assembly factor BamB family protein n=1 Tax=Nocardioides sp. MH1 TaxID=3242490 RepID=UPI003522E61F
MTPNYCRHCGAGLAAGVAFCASCGERVDQRTSAAPAAEVTAARPLPTPPPPPPPLVVPAPAPQSAFPFAPAPPPRRRSPHVSILLGVVLVMFLAGAGIAFVVSRSADRDQDAGPTGTREGDLEVLPAGFDGGVSLTSQPGRTWVFHADDVLPGGTVYVATTLDDAIVATVGRNRQQVVAGIDPDDGSVLWQDSGERIGDWCSAVDDATRLVCSLPDEAGVAVVDARTGEIGETYEVRHAEWVNSIGPVLYVGSRIGGHWSYSETLTALDLDTFDRLWSTDLNADGGSEDYGSSVVQAAGGDLFIHTGPTAWRLSPGGFVLSRFAMGLQDDLHDGYRTGSGSALRRWDRSLVLRGHGAFWWGSDYNHLVIDGRVGLGETLYDVATGDALWSTSDVTGYDVTSASWEWSPLEDYLLATDFSDDYEPIGTTLVDPGSGEALWHSDTGIEAYSSVETDDAFATVTGDEGYREVVVLASADGEIAWSADLSEIDSYDDYSSLVPGLTSSTLIATSDLGIKGFTDFAGTGARDDSGDTTDSGSDDTAYTTACGSPPEFTPVASVAANGGITITYEVHATCPGGQWLNLSQLRVPFVVDGDGSDVDSGYLYADGYFDFSADPYWIPDEGETLDLVYPYGQTTVPADDIAQAIADDGGSGEVVFVPCEQGPSSTEGAVPDSPEYGADPSDPNVAAGSPDDSVSTEDREESALEALQRIAAEDEVYVEGLDWTAQLSSKKPGTYDDGMVYDSYDDILALHLQLRAQFPGSLLLFSSDWPGTYGPKSRGYWVTLSGDSDLTTQPVLDWCNEQGRGSGDCWAVRVRRTGDPADNVDHAPADERNN